MTRLLFVHGWGFDASIWDTVRTALAPIETMVWDRGYFGLPECTDFHGPTFVVGHSLGSLLLAAGLPPSTVGFVAINGFDRFAGEGLVAPRVLDRMRRRFDEDPASVLGEFRGRAGALPHSGTIVVERLADDLERLATLDARGKTLPDVVLHGARDPILPAPMRDGVFAGAPRITHADAGHLLPVTHPEWCAMRIRERLP